MPVIALLQEKGGSGRTTLATNLAAAAHLAGSRSLVIDLDTQGSAFEWSLKRSEGSALSAVVVVRAVAESSRRKAKAQPLTASTLLEMGRGYDAVFLDGPPRLDALTLAAAVAADVVVMPVQSGPYDVWAAGTTLEALDQADAIRAELGKKPVRRFFVLNRANPRETLTAETRAELEDVGCLAGIVGQRTIFKKSAACGEAVGTVEPKGAAAIEIRRVWRSIR